MAKRNYFIDILKGIAVILVLFNHYEWDKSNPFNTHIYYWVICMAVPIFMLSTGYVFAVSSEAKNHTLKSSYSWNEISKKLVRYTMPFLWFYLFETILFIISENIGYFDYLSVLGYPKEKITLLNTVKYFFYGGRGKHGTYYFPVLIQITFLLPIIYHTVKKHRSGLWLIFGLNFIFEVLKAPLRITTYTWRLLAVRYIFLLAMGCYIHVWRKNLGKWYKYLLFFLVGIIYVIEISYGSIISIQSKLPIAIIVITAVVIGCVVALQLKKAHIMQIVFVLGTVGTCLIFRSPDKIFTSWIRTAMPCTFYIAPIYLLLITKFKDAKHSFLEKIGKASYHIFLVQIIYYNYFAPLVWTFISNNYIGMALSLIICLGAGYGYYKLYDIISHKAVCSPSLSC